MKTSRTSLHNQFAHLIYATLFLTAMFLMLPNDVLGQVGPRPMARRPPTLAAGNSSVRGRVVYKDNSEPLKGARLRVVSASNDEGELVVFANDRGEFRIDNLAGGTYYVTVEGGGVAMPSGFGMRIPLPVSAIPRREDFEPIAPRHDAEFTVDGTSNADVEIRIERGAKVSGKVLKPNGSPGTNVGVTLLSRGDRQSVARFSARTDQDGNYRFENVPAGDYVVGAAAENPQGATDMRARLRGESQTVTYHPAATNLREATTVHLDSGAQVSGINVTLVMRQSFAISGRVLRQQGGVPIAGATVLLRNKDSEFGASLAPGMGQRTTKTDEEGRWSFSNISEGSYTVTALSSPQRSTDDAPADREQAYRQSRQRYLVAQQDVIIAGNLSELLLSISGPGTVQGTVEMDNGQPLPTDLVIHLEFVREGGRPGAPLPVRVQPDGTFSVDQIQGGDVYLYAASTSGQHPVYVKSVTADGKNLQSVPLTVIEGAVVGPVRVVVSTDSGRVNGRVSTADKQSAVDYVVLLLPVNQEKQRFRTTYFTSKVAADGTYGLNAPAGEYFIFARQRDQLPPLITNQFIQKELVNSERISLGAGDKKTVDLRAP
ncbi:MAG TPA: carboxypeptidase-like regulatory domain-containing protein [Pyrinomonadaceae bacterium]|nr:carboxypeptidase-like regulatory domain-containing protein [Pyrinomonadaceae bacterium]